MKKRKSPITQGEESDDSAMELVEAEEKVEAGESDDEEDDNNKMDVGSDDDDDDDEDGEDPEERSPEDNSFMDTFYGLSSTNATERSQAANAMMHHCLLGPDANTKDATYALRRLLNGLCSGRAASRQGNASALATFLKVSFEGGQLNEIKSSQQTTFDDGSESILGYVRQRLLKATEPGETQGRRKGSEERDYQFGRLFGILGVVRSGILNPNEDSDFEQVQKVVTGFVSDLVELYWHKKWMREPAAHAIGTILNAYYALAAAEEGGEDAKKLVQHLVTEIVIPKLLQDEAGSIALENYTAEQLAVAATIQAQASDHHVDGLPAPLHKPVFSTETIPIIVKTLVETSSVAQPRMHLVWDAIWSFLTEPIVLKKKRNGPPKLSVRNVREEPLLGGDSTRDITASLVRHVVVEGLLRVDIAEGTAGKTTHEKRALALSIVRNLMGVPFNSSMTGATQLQMEAEDMEHIMTPVIIRRLFLDVVCTGSGGKKKPHTLKPLVLQSLELMTDSMIQDTSEAGMNRRVASAQYIVRVEPRFDALTKTSTIVDLVGLGEATAAEFGTHQSAAVQNFFDFLEGQIDADLKPSEILANVDLLYSSAKRLLRLKPTGDSESKDCLELEEFRPHAIERILGFYMASSFFDCSAVDPDKSSTTPKKSKKGKKKSITAVKHAVVEAAVRFNNRNKGTLPFEARSILSERYYSLLAEYINATLHARSGPIEKDLTMLNIVADMGKGWQLMEAAGAKPLFQVIDGGDISDESESPDKIVSQLQGLANDLAAKSKDSDDAAVVAHKRCAVGCAALASTLFLHLLGCGKPEAIMDEDDVTTEEDDDSADILDAITEIGELAPALLDSSVESEHNPLAAFAEVCMNLFASGVTSGGPGRGASSKLLKEAIKFAWMGVLSASAASNQDLLDTDVISVLVNGIGAGGGTMEAEAGDDEEEDDDDDEDSDDDMDEDTGEFADFSKVGDILGNSDDDDDEEKQDEKISEPQGADAEQDVELDNDRLNSLLEDDSDAEIDVGELEHHEGADAALAMLIKMRQDARKSSRKARERLELEKQIRCTLLLDTLLEKSEKWAALLRSDVILELALPLLTFRNKLEKSLANSTGKSGNADANTKKAMVEKLTSMLNTKLFKLKFAGMTTTKSVDLVEYCGTLANALLDMARSNISKDQRACCSLGMVTTVKALAGSEGALEVSSVYITAVEEWSQKGTTRLDSSLFEDLNHHCHRVAQATLLAPLSTAAADGKSNFVKNEAFRLLALLLNPNFNSGSSETDALALEKTKESLDDVSATILVVLKSAGTQRFKRIRDMLKATEKLVEFVQAVSYPLSNIDDISEAISKLGFKHEDEPVHAICKKLTSLIADASKKSQAGDRKSVV